MIDTTFLHHLDRLSLLVNKKITSNYTGERFTDYTGKGLIFKDYTIYAPGEDFRAVDWKVFGRTDKLFVKRFEEERNLTIHIVIDMSASMAFGKKITKADFAGMLGIGFAYMALKNNERFVLSTFSETLQLFKPRRGRKQLIDMIDHLNNNKPGGTSKFEDSLFKYKKLIDTKSMIVIISDFLYPTEQIRNVLRRFKHHNIHLIQVLDPIEKELNIEGDFKLRDLETKEQLRTYISPFFRKSYKNMLAEHNAKIQRACDEVRARFHSFSTETQSYDAFFELLMESAS
jgi:uncharacterized protein (DUF58 family)